MKTTKIYLKTNDGESENSEKADVSERHIKKAILILQMYLHDEIEVTDDTYLPYMRKRKFPGIPKNFV